MRELVDVKLKASQHRPELDRLSAVLRRGGKGRGNWRGRWNRGRAAYARTADSDSAGIGVDVPRGRAGDDQHGAESGGVPAGVAGRLQQRPEQWHAASDASFVCVWRPGISSSASVLLFALLRSVSA